MGRDACRRRVPGAEFAYPWYAKPKAERGRVARASVA